MAREEQSVPLSGGEDRSLRRSTESGTAHQSVEARNMELMQTLDDAWNAQDVEIFRARHKPDVIVRWPGQPNPTVGIEDHTAESIAFGSRSPIRSSTTGPIAYS